MVCRRSRARRCHTAAGPVVICGAENGDPVAGACAGPFAHPFVGLANQLVDVDISATVPPRVGAAGANYLTVLAFTTPTTVTDHIVGLRFTYAAGGNTPAGMVAFFAGSVCPASWTEYAAARGRVVVGMPSGGSAESLVGTSLPNVGTRVITDVPSHHHAVNPPSTGTTNSGTHTHSVSAGTGVGLNDFGLTAGLTAVSDNQTSGAGGAHTHNVDIPQFDSATTGSTTVDVTMPYVQLIACRES